jgi:hypothetical protein
MTYRDSDALFLPARAPQHAVPLGFPIRRRFAGLRSVFRRLRRLVRQVLQLVITAMAWAAGIGLVTGSIVLVATATAPRQLSARADGNALPHLTPHMAGSPGYHVLAQFSGHGNRTTGQFSVRAKRRWQLQWSYSCSPKAGAAQFELLANLAADRALSPSIEEYAASGHGTVTLHATGQQHYLVVKSACSWRVNVLQPV